MSMLHVIFVFESAPLGLDCRLAVAAQHLLAKRNYTHIHTHTHTHTRWRMANVDH